MEPEIRIRSANIDDLATAREILNLCDLPLEGLEDQFGDNYCIVELEDEIVGLGGIEKYGSLGLIRSVAVKPGVQRKQIGTAIVKERLAWARRAGLSGIYLLTTTADQFFVKLGFIVIRREDVAPEIKESSEYSTVCPDSAVVMFKSLF
jgi:amino-acid N-acetyltransferase